MTAKSLCASTLLFSCAASAQSPAPPSRLAAITNVTDALVSCVPGTPIDDCAAALTKGGYPAQVRGEKSLGAKLQGKFSNVRFQAKRGAGIREVMFVGDLDPGRSRQVVLDWFKAHTKDLKPSGFSCGYSHTGPGWTVSNGAFVGLGFDQSKTPEAGRGKNLDRYFVNTTDEVVAVCFQSRDENPTVTTLMREFVHDLVAGQAR